MISAGRDAINLERRWSRLISIVTDCYTAVLRTSFSVIVTDALDFGVDLLDADRSLIAHPPQSMPTFDHALSNGLRHVLRELLPEELAPGDVLICNDPWAMAGHLFDIGVFTPVFDYERPVAYMTAMANVTDIGGTRVRHQVREIHGERLIEHNVRLSHQVIGDVHALVAANALGVERAKGMLRDEGLQNLRGVSTAIRERSATAMRAAIATLPDTSVWVEQACDGADQPLSIRVEGETLTVDPREAPPQVPHGSINCTRSITEGVILSHLHALLCPNIPVNAGLFEPIRFESTPGSLLDCTAPAAANPRSKVLWNLAPAVHRAFEPLLGDNAQAPIGYPCSIKSYGCYPNGSAFSNYLFQGGSQGASGRVDGLNTLIFPTSAGNVSIEIFEQCSPILVECKEYIQDSSGSGAHRGGLGQRVRVRKLDDQDGTTAMIAIWPEGLSFVNDGFQSGQAGGPTVIEVGHPDGTVERVSCGGATLDLSDTQTTVTLVMPGDAGYGPPRDRTRTSIREDILDEYVSEQVARITSGYEHDY